MERRRVLLGEDRGRHQHQHLAAGRRHLERRPQRDLGLAEADVAAHQPVHRPVGLHVLLDRRRWPRCWSSVSSYGKPSSSRAIHSSRSRCGGFVTCWRRAYRASSSPASSRTAIRARVLSVCHALPPSLASAGAAAVGADVAADLGQLVVRHVQAVVAVELEVQVVADDPATSLVSKRTKRPDAVVLVHDVVAGAEIGDGRRARGRSGPGRGAPRRRNSCADGSTASRRRRGDEPVAELRDARSAPPARADPPPPPGARRPPPGAAPAACVRASPGAGSTPARGRPARTSARSSFSASAIPTEASAGGWASKITGWPSGISSSAEAASISARLVRPERTRAPPRVAQAVGHLRRALASATSARDSMRRPRRGRSSGQRTMPDGSAGSSPSPPAGWTSSARRRGRARPVRGRAATAG